MADLREKRVELILQQLEELPTLPAVALRVLEVTGDTTSSARDVVQLIGSDPSLTARILQLTRRASLGVRSEVQTIDRAVVLLGFDAVRNAVLAISIYHVFADRKQDPTKAPSAPAEKRFNREEFWTHCVAVACCAELLAEAAATRRSASGAPPSAASSTAAGPARSHERNIAPTEAFICGLLHDLGKVALDAVLPKSFARVVEAAELLCGNIADIERTVIGLDHMVAGKRLAERWQLPQAIRESIWLHGQPPQAFRRTSRARS